VCFCTIDPSIQLSKYAMTAAHKVSAARELQYREKTTTINFDICEIDHAVFRSGIIKIALVGNATSQLYVTSRDEHYLRAVNYACKNGNNVRQFLYKKFAPCSR